MMTEVKELSEADMKRIEVSLKNTWRQEVCLDLMNKLTRLNDSCKSKQSDELEDSL